MTLITQTHYIFRAGTSTITSNGVPFTRPITIDCGTGTVQLADALELPSTRTLTLTSGTFDAVSYNVTAGRHLFWLSGTHVKNGFGNMDVALVRGNVWTSSAMG
jgi:hypothetical protein